MDTTCAAVNCWTGGPHVYTHEINDIVPSPVLFCMLSKVADSIYFMLPLYICCLIPVCSFHSGFFWWQCQISFSQTFTEGTQLKALTTCCSLLYSPCNFMVPQQFSKKTRCLLMYNIILYIICEYTKVSYIIITLGYVSLNY